jgi:hypothetical protein
VKALAMIASAALQAEDFAHAFETSEAMIKTVSQLCSSSDAPQAELNDAKEVCWVSCFQLGRQTEFPDVPKKLRLLGHALEFCPADRLPEILAAWRRLEKEDEDVAQHVGGEGVPSPHRHGFTPQHGRARTRTGQPGAPAPSLASRLQNIHLPASPLVMADGAAIADTFSRVASKLPFSMTRPQAHPAQSEGGSGDGQGRVRDEDGKWPSLDREEVSAQASRAFQRGIGWLIGADE